MPSPRQASRIVASWSTVTSRSSMVSVTSSQDARTSRSPTGWRSAPSGRGRRCWRRASPGRRRRTRRGRPRRPMPDARRATTSSWRTVPTRHGTHCPHDSSRKKAAIRRTWSTRSTASSSTSTTPEPSVAPRSRVPSIVSARSRSSGPTNEPAAPPSSTARSSDPARTPPASSISSPERDAELDLVHARPFDRTGEAEQLAAGAPAAQDRQHVGERLDVVDDGRLAEQTDLHGERRLVARLATVALDRVEDRRLLTADVGAGAADDGDVEGESTAEDVGAEEPALARLADRRVERCACTAGTRRAGRSTRGRSRWRRRRSSSTRSRRTGRPPSAHGP